MPRPVEPGAVLRKPGTWVLIVALVYAGAQLLLLDPNRFYEWDEVIYVGEVSTDVPSISFSAHRARGITMVVAPVTLLTDSILVLRLYLIAASTTALATAFLIWRRVIAWGAPVAAAFFSIGWMTVFYGSEVSPNLYVAFAAVALLGMSIRYARSRSRWDLFWVGALVALAMLLRPSDAVVLAIGVTVVVAFIGRKALGAFAAALVGGVVLGALPWIVEASVRWDGPFDRLQTASEIVGGGTTFNLLDLMRLLDGPLVGPQTTDQLPVVGLLWVAGLASLGVVGLFLGQRDDRESGVAALMTSFLVAFPTWLPPALSPPGSCCRP